MPKAEVCQSGMRMASEREMERVSWCFQLHAEVRINSICSN